MLPHGPIVLPAAVSPRVSGQVYLTDSGQLRDGIEEADVPMAPLGVSPAAALAKPAPSARAITEVLIIVLG